MTADEARKITNSINEAKVRLARGKLDSAIHDRALQGFRVIFNINQYFDMLTLEQIDDFLVRLTKDGYKLQQDSKNQYTVTWY
jgi:hypothetical protein